MSRTFGTLLARLWGKSHTLALASKKNVFRPTVENLEVRCVPASISGHVFVDTAGSGAASLGAGERGVLVGVVADTNHNGVMDRGDRLAGLQVTDRNGAYSFKGLAAGTYFVREGAPGNEVRTMPDNADGGYTVKVAKNDNVTDQDFANFDKLNRRSVNRVSFTVTNASGTHNFADLKGHTQAGDTVTANFTVPRGAGNVTLSLVTYTTSGPVKGAAGPATAPAAAQVTTATFAPGQYSMSIKLPNNFYQVDFVVGSAIKNLNESASSNLNYRAQDRLLSQDNGGQAPVTPVPVPVTPATLSGTVFLDDGDGAFSRLDGSVDGATVALVGTDNQGKAVNVSVTTDSTGHYSFANVAPGVYTVSVAAFSLINGQTSVPADEVTQTQAQTDIGTISNVHVASGAALVDFNFLETSDNTGNAGS